MSEDAGFLSRWSRRKAQGRSGPPEPAAVVTPPVAPAVVPAVAPAAAALPAAPATEAPPPPTFDDVAALAPGDEISRFVVRGVDEDVKRAAIKKLFTDPHFNVMDGLDIYIDDYSQPDPIPMAMLRQMNQSKFLGLFADEEAAEARAAAPADAGRSLPPPTGEGPVPPDAAAFPAPEPDPAPFDGAAVVVPHTPDEDADLQLQPDRAAGRPGAA